MTSSDKQLQHHLGAYFADYLHIGGSYINFRDGICKAM